MKFNKKVNFSVNIYERNKPYVVIKYKRLSTLVVSQFTLTNTLSSIPVFYTSKWFLGGDILKILGGIWKKEDYVADRWNIVLEN